MTHVLDTQGAPINHPDQSDTAFDALTVAEQMLIELGGSVEPQTSDNGTGTGDVGTGGGNFFFGDAPQPVGDADVQELTLPGGDTVQILQDDFGNFVTGRFKTNQTGGNVVALEPIDLPGGWVLIPLAGGAKPILLPPSDNNVPQYFAVPEDPTKVLAVLGGSIRVIERNQAPIAAVEIGSEVQSDGTRRIFFADGTHRDLQPSSARFELGPVQNRGGQQFVETSPGRFTQLPPTLKESERTVDEMITRFLGNGEVEAAIALHAFKNQPTSLQLLAAAEKFATAPGDQVAISAIARGHTLVSPPPTGTVQRIADPPEFLQTEIQKLRRQIFGGEATAGDFDALLQGADQRIRESEKARTGAEKALADKLQAERDNQLKDLIARVEEAEKRAGESEKLLQQGSTLSAESQSALAGQDTSNLQQNQIDLFNLFNSGGLSLGASGTSPAGGTTFDADSRFRELIAGAEARPSPVSDPTPNPFVSEENQQIIDEPRFTPATEERVAELEAIQEPAPTQATSGFFTGLNAAGEDDFFHEGGEFDDRTAVVGEDGPEIVVLPPGTKVLSNEDTTKVDSVAELKALLRGTGKRKKRGKKQTDEERLREMLDVQPLAHGGTVESLLPIGVRQALRGGSIEPTRRRLSTAAGLPVLSGQARQRLLPEELDVFDRLRAEAGIPLGAFEQEQASALPGVLRRQPSRFGARVAR